MNGVSMPNTKTVYASVCSFTIDSTIRWIDLKQPNAEVYRCKYEIDGQRYSINIEIIPEKNLTAQNLAETKYRYNVNSAFIRENIPPFQLLGQKAGLVAWSCRYRWVDGGSAPYRVQDMFIEVNDKIVRLSFMAAPVEFDLGVIKFIQIAQSVKPL